MEKRKLLERRFTNLTAAYQKVKAKLEYFTKKSKDEFENKFDILSQKDRQNYLNEMLTWHWNEHHDLLNRIEERLKETWSDIKKVDFEENGFSVLI